MRRIPGQFASNPRKPTPRRGGSKVSRAGRLSDPRQNVALAVYKTPPITSSAPSTIRNIVASQFVVATHKNGETQSRAASIRSGRQVHVGHHVLPTLRGWEVAQTRICAGVNRSLPMTARADPAAAFQSHGGGPPQCVGTFLKILI